MSLFRSVILPLCLIVAATFAQADLDLVRDGKPVAAIAVMDESDEAIEAAETLNTFIQMMTGTALRLEKVELYHKGGAAGTRVLENTRNWVTIGTRGQLAPIDFTREFRPLVDQIRDDGFALYSDGDRRMVITADKGIGLIYGVYEVLERLGCRWFFPGELGQEIPSKTTLSLPEMLELQNPDMVDRNMWYAYGSRPDWQKGGYTLWQKRNKMGGVRFSAGHNLARIVPPAELGQTHPEYFPLIGGQRRVPKPGEHGWQPCTSNPEVIALAVAAADKYFIEKPDAASFSLSPNDGYGWCECDNCKAQDPPAQRDQRNQFKARRTLLFVNAVARQIAPKHPGKFLAWYAYAGTVEPPEDIRAEPNVLTALAHYGYVGCNIHAMADPACSMNQKFMGLLEGWEKVADQLMIREYWSGLVAEDQAMARIAVGYSLAEDIPMLVKRGFIAASAESEPEYGSSALNFYLAAKLMWDSDQPLEPLLAGYYDGMYGPAGPAMRAFFEGIVQRCRDRGHRGPFFEDAEYGQMAAELEKILPLAATDKQRVRIQMTRDYVNYTSALQQYNLRPSKALREQVEAYVASVEAGEQFTMDTVMHKHQFAVRSRAAAIKEPEQYLVGKVQAPAAGAAMPEKALKLAPVVRGQQVVALLVQPGEKLQGEVQLRRLGRNVTPVGWILLDEAGKPVAQGESTLEETGAFDLPDAAPGTYTLIANAGSNASRLLSPLQGVAIAGREFGLLGAQPLLYFWVPAGVTEFDLQLETSAPGETGKMQVFDPDGKLVGEADSVQTGLAKITAPVPANMTGRAWSVKLGAASSGVCEDLKLFLDSKLPPFLSVDPARVVVPK